MAQSQFRRALLLLILASHTHVVDSKVTLRSAVVRCEAPQAEAELAAFTVEVPARSQVRRTFEKRWSAGAVDSLSNGVRHPTPATQNRSTLLLPEPLPVS